MSDVIVLGTGIVGVSVAIHLQRRGRDVLLVDRKAPGQETSFGNAGVIQREAVRPRAFPRDAGELFRIATKQGIDTRYDLSALPGLASPLAQYWWNSAPHRYQRIVADYATLIAHSIGEHSDLITASGAEGLIEKQGWMVLYRTAETRDKAFADAEGDARDHGVGIAELDGAALAAAEPALQIPMAGALHWTAPWTVRDPGALAAAYADYFRRLGGTIAIGDAETLSASGSGWKVTTASGPASAAEVVLALGPWAKRATQKLGYRLPLFVKRGYHREYQHVPGAALNRPLLDAEGGFLLAPMHRGVRLTTGAEFARLDAPKNETQVDRAEIVARELAPLGDRLDASPWMGARPCTPDMKPVIGRAPNHRNVWFAFGHAHHGLTLGAVTGRLIAEMVVGEAPFVNPRPFAAERFGGSTLHA